MRFLFTLRAVRFAASGLCLLGALGARSQAQQILETYADTLTTYKAAATSVQGVLPSHVQRGVGLDGSWRSSPGLPLAIAGNPFEDAWVGKDRHGDLNLATGAYSPSEVDLALPANGFSWVVGRSYNARQETSGGSAQDSNGYQGWNWHQTSQPEIVLYDDADNTKDVLYLVYGAGAYAEYQRTGSSSSDYKGKNGAAGVFVYAAGASTEPDTFTLTDQHGNEAVFFGFDGDSGAATGQLWKVSDPAGNVAYVGHATTGSTAISSGYSSGRITTAYDTSDRRFTYTYTSVDGTQRLTEVKAETKTGGTWTSPTGVATVGLVNYAYYASGDSDIANGSSGDLKKVTITEYLDDSVTLTKKKYFRYWKGSYHATTNPGYDHALWYVVDFEGTRNFDWADSTFDEDFLGATENSLKPYAAAYFEYDSSHRVRKTWMNGQCGCSGAANGVFELTYGTNGSFSSSAGYDLAWKSRTLVDRPDGSFLTQYFDELGQPLSQVITTSDPAGSPSGTWVTAIVRDSMGCVDWIGTPASVNSYTHSTGAIDVHNTTGLVTKFGREGSGNMLGFLTERKHTAGDDFLNNSIYYDELLTWTSTSKTVGGQTLVRPLVSAQRRYHTEGTSSGSNYDQTSYSYVYHSSPDDLAVKTKTTTHPTVTTAKNGSNSSTSRSTYIREDGRVTFEKDEDDHITHHAYTNGQETTTIQDADTTLLSPPFGFSSSGTPLHLATTTTYTSAGKLSLVTPPHNVNRTMRTRLADHRLVTLAYNDYDAGGTPTFYGPVSYTVTNHAGRVEARGTIALSANQTTTATSGHIDETKDDAVEAVATGTVERLTTYHYDESGTHVAEERAYFAMPGSPNYLPGTDGTHYDPTTYADDDSGRRIRTVEPSGTIRRTVYDAIGRTSEHWIGTDDTGLPGSTLSGTSNMVKTDFVEYDLGGSGKNGLVTSRTLRVLSTSTDERVTSYEYDLRGRLLLRTNPTAPHALHQYDNLGRRTATGLYSATGSISLPTDLPTSETTNRLALNETAFDEKGQVWKTVRHKIDDADGSDDDTLEALSWYDDEGQLVKVDGEELKKVVYDRIGRVTDEYVLAVDNDSAYTDVDDVTGDIVLEERQTRYDATTGVVLFRARIDRFHSDIGGSETTGPLDTNASALTIVEADLEGRIQLTAYWYDRVEREIDRVEYGVPTYGSGSWTRPGSAPSRSATELRTTTAYATDGTVESITDPKAIVTRYEYDRAGRRTKEIRNYDNGVASGAPSGTDDNVTTAWAYTDGLMVTLTADMPSGQTDQVTRYIYGSTPGTPSQMVIATGHLLRAVAYPDSTNGGTTLANINSDSSDVASFAYNAQGEEVYKKDQAGSVIESVYEASGRNTQKRVTNVASGFDNAILRIARTHDGLGRPSEVVQYDNATAGSGTAQDGVKYTYDDWGNVEKFEMDRDSAVSGAGNQYEVSYTWAKATTGRNTLRKTAMTMPGGRAITYTYRTTGGLHDDEVSRVSTVVDGGTVTLAQYDYLGVATVVRTRYNEANVWSELYTGAGAYGNLDRFNRVISSRWTKDLATDIDFYRVDLTYDENGNITSADDYIHSGFDVKYTMDDANRLVRADEGTLSAGSITSRTRDQQWTLSHTGNWDLDKVDLNGDLDWADADELNDTRTHNAVNELTGRNTDSGGGNEHDLVYDAVGNLTDDDEDCKYEHDVFGRLRKVKRTSNSNLVAEYRYNGLAFRIGVHEDTDADGDVDGSDKWFYDAFDERWRHLARYRESDSSPKEDFVPHQAGPSGRGGSSYIDLLICRNRDANTAWTSASDGVCEERLYLCQALLGDVISIVSVSGISEWVSYSSYGVPYGIPRGDSNSDGDCDSSDASQIQAWIGASHYDVRGDLDIDGDVDSGDYAIAFGAVVVSGRGVLSQTDVRNRRGHHGLPQNVSLHYWGRWRVIQAVAGRWLRRDPAGYVDGTSLYEYVGSSPRNYADPSGLKIMVRGSAWTEYGECLLRCLTERSATFRNMKHALDGSPYTQNITMLNNVPAEPGGGDNYGICSEVPSPGEGNSNSFVDVSPPGGGAGQAPGTDPAYTFAHEISHASGFADSPGQGNTDAEAEAFEAAVKADCGGLGSPCPECDKYKKKKKATGSGH